MQGPTYIFKLIKSMQSIFLLPAHEKSFISNCLSNFFSCATISYVNLRCRSSGTKVDQAD